MGVLNCACIKNGLEENQFFYNDSLKNALVEKIKERLSSPEITVESIKDSEFQQIFDSLNIKEICDEYESQLSENTLNITDSTILKEQIITIPPIKITNTPENMIEYYKVGVNKNSKFTGKGIHILKNDYVYYGNFQNDEYNGKGLLITNKQDNLFGDWVNGACTGQGILKLIGKFTYEGKFINNKKNGYGIETYPNGAKYEGYFIDNKKCGKGKYILNNGESYEGSFLNDLYDGEGIYKWSNEGREYRGHFKEGNMEGYGINKFEDGSVYEGYYKDGQKHGKGKYSWNNGKKFSGNWLNNKLHGDGCYEVNGEKFFVTFRFGKLISVRRVGNNQDFGNSDNNNIALEGRVKFNKNDIINKDEIENVDDFICKKCGFLIADPQKCCECNCNDNYCLDCIKGNENFACENCGSCNFDTNLSLLHDLISKVKIFCKDCNKELDYNASLKHVHGEKKEYF